MTVSFAEATAAARRIQEAHERVERATAVAFPHGQCSFDAEWRDACDAFRGECRSSAVLLAGFVLAGDTERHPKVQGRCPNGCGETLFLGSGGYVTCSLLGCTEPCAASDLLAGGGV